MLSLSLMPFCTHISYSHVKSSLYPWSMAATINPPSCTVGWLLNMQKYFVDNLHYMYDTWLNYKYLLYILDTLLMEHINSSIKYFFCFPHTIHSHQKSTNMNMNIFNNPKYLAKYYMDDQHTNNVKDEISMNEIFHKFHMKLLIF